MTAAPYDLILGLDRADKKADLCLLETATGQRRAVVMDTAPEALWEWLAESRQQHPQARVGVCLEQPAVQLIPFLEAYAWITLHPINPITLQKYREAFVTSRAKDDTKDAEYLADLLFTHQAQLPVWAPQDSARWEDGCDRLAHRKTASGELEVNEPIQIRIHGDAARPVLVYLPGLHGDWTLVSSFRAAVAGRVRFDPAQRVVLNEACSSGQC